MARQDIAKKGFKPSTHQIAVFTELLTEGDEQRVRKECVRLQEEMYEFAEGRKKPTFTGDLKAMLIAFERDPDSNYHAWDYDTRRGHNTHAAHLIRDYGHLKLAKTADEQEFLNARTIKRIYERARWPAGKPEGDQEERGKVSLAYARIGILRTVFSYGIAFEVDPNCERIRTILSEMTFENARPRTEAMTLRQCEDIIAAAHKIGFASIALAQAIQFDFRARQRDVIGVWVPEREKGISVLPPHQGRKWLRGMRHEEISSTGLLSHPISKGRKLGKVLERDINLYPMVKAEMDRIPEDRRTGPIVICERTGRPWKQNHFRMKWRECAEAAGVPKGMWNMDSRAGGITETIEATKGNVEAARKEAEHSDIKTTMKYSRRKREATAEAAVIVADFRSKNRT